MGACQWVVGVLEGGGAAAAAAAGAGAGTRAGGPPTGRAPPKSPAFLLMRVSLHSALSHSPALHCAAG